MRKEEYIEKYGEEAWKKHLELRNKANQKWRKKTGYGAEWARKHRLKKAEFIEAYGEVAYRNFLDSKKKYGHKYYEKHKEEVLAKTQKYHNEHREGRNDYTKEYMKDYRKTIEYRASDLCSRYRKFDANKGFDIGNVTPKWVLENILNSKCVYCGDSNWEHLGCDRIDNTKPHDIDNLVCCCGVCNIERADRYTMEEFIEHRKTHPRDEKPQKLEKIVEINGKKVIRKVL